MVARGEEEEDKELMDDRVGRGDAREARIRYMVACRRAAGQTGGFVVPLGLGLGLAWTVSLVLPVPLAFGSLSLVGEAVGVPGYGRYDDPRSGFLVLGSGSASCWVSV